MTIAPHVFDYENWQLRNGPISPLTNRLSTITPKLIAYPFENSPSASLALFCWRVGDPGCDLPSRKELLGFALKGPVPSCPIGPRLRPFSQTVWSPSRLCASCDYNQLGPGTALKTDWHQPYEARLCNTILIFICRQFDIDMTSIWCWYWKTINIGMHSLFFNGSKAPRAWSALICSQKNHSNFEIEEMILILPCIEFLLWEQKNMHRLFYQWLFFNIIV